MTTVVKSGNKLSQEAGLPALSAEFVCSEAIKLLDKLRAKEAALQGEDIIPLKVLL